MLVQSPFMKNVPYVYSRAYQLRNTDGARVYRGVLSMIPRVLKPGLRVFTDHNTKVNNSESINPHSTFYIQSSGRAQIMDSVSVYTETKVKVQPGA